MVVVDSSVIIPLARIGHLDLIQQVLDNPVTLEDVYTETVEEGKGRPGVSAIEDVFDSWLGIERIDGKAQAVAELEGLTETDARLVVLAEKRDEILLTNDRAIVNVAEARDVEVYWLTTLVLRAVRENVLNSEEGKELLYDLVDAGMNLDNKVYARLLKQIEEIS